MARLDMPANPCVYRVSYFDDAGTERVAMFATKRERREFLGTMRPRNVPIYYMYKYGCKYFGV
jgi:hypothetical protein